MLSYLCRSPERPATGIVLPALQAGFHVGLFAGRVSPAGSQGFSLGFIPAALQAARCHASSISIERVARRGKAMFIGPKAPAGNTEP
jgi:hypothetical protein